MKTKFKNVFSKIFKKKDNEEYLKHMQEANERFSELSPKEQAIRIEQARKDFVNFLKECQDTMPKKKKA